MRRRLLIGLVCVWRPSRRRQVAARSATLTRGRRGVSRGPLEARVSCSSGSRPIPATGIVRDRSRTDGSASSDNHVKVGSIASVGFGLTGYLHRRRARLGAARRSCWRGRDHAADVRDARLPAARLVLSLAEPPHRRARVDERGVVDRHRAAARRRAVGAPVLQGRSRRSCGSPTRSIGGSISPGC